MLLELGEGKCGRVTAVGIDLWRAAGMRRGKSSSVGISSPSYTMMEDGTILDADAFGGTEMVRNSDGSVPSLSDLSQVPLAIDQPGSHLELGYTVV